MRGQAALCRPSSSKLSSIHWPVRKPGSTGLEAMLIAADLTTLQGCETVAEAVGASLAVWTSSSTYWPVPPLQAGGFAALGEAEWQAELNLSYCPQCGWTGRLCRGWSRKDRAR